MISGGKGVDEAAENRNYLASRMSEEVGEVIRVLQLTTYDEDEWDSDNLVRLELGPLSGAHAKKNYTITAFKSSNLLEIKLPRFFATSPIRVFITAYIF